MRKWWIGAALALALGSGPARAQHLPYAPGPAPLPEPVPECRQPGPAQPPINPGPLGPMQAPLGPPDDLSLSCNAPYAFDDSYYNPEHAFYFHAGAMALMRQGLGHRPVAMFDPNPRQIRPDGLEVNTAPQANSLLLQDTSDIHPNFAWGPRATVGYIFDNQAVELTAFYLPENGKAVTTAVPGQVFTFFNHAPAGFQGDNNLFHNADFVQTTFKTAVGNAEANYRCWPWVESGFDWILGVRYFDVQERLGMTVSDDGLTSPPAGVSNQVLNAQYAVRTHNRMVAPQLGIEWERHPFRWLGLGFNAKGAWGANFTDVDVTFQRGDGLPGFIGHRSHTQFSHLYEIGLFADFYLLERVKLRGGYSTFWFLHAVTANDQVDYDLSHIDGLRKDNGNIFYHGPMVELQFLF